MKLLQPRFLCAVLVLLIIHSVQAQETANTDDLYNLRDLTPPSPNAAALAKYVEWPVNLNTGTPGIDLPLYELKGRTLSVPISLSYHASGIKVAEHSSWVGTGWSLQAGGMITRSVRGIPDEYASVGYSFIRRQFPDYNNTFEQQSTPSNSWKTTVMESTRNEVDSEHDLYYFNAMGRSFRFLFKDSVMGVSRPVIQTIPYSNVIIKGDFTSWTVTLEDGTKLVFGGTGFNETTVNQRYGNLNVNASFVSSWYLQSITSPNGEKIRFKYTSTSSVKMVTSFSMDDLVGWEDAFGNYRGGGTTSSKIKTQLITLLQPDSIVSETGFVKFITRSDSMRLDMPGMRALSSLIAYSKIQNQIRQVDAFVFKTRQQPAATSFDVATPGEDYKKYRLMLDAVEHTGVAQTGTIPRWKFTYHATRLPSTLSFAQDHYGYFNGATTNISLLPRAHVSSPYGGSSNTDGFFPPLHEWGNNRNSNEAAMQAGMLTMITYPTGGTSQFAFEANKYIKNEEELRDTTIISGSEYGLQSISFCQFKIVYHCHHHPSVHLSVDIQHHFTRVERPE